MVCRNMRQRARRGKAVRVQRGGQCGCGLAAPRRNGALPRTLRLFDSSALRSLSVVSLLMWCLSAQFTSAICPAAAGTDPPGLGRGVLKVTTVV